MKKGPVFNFIVSLILLPLWLGLVTDFIIKIKWLHYTVTGITTLAALFCIILLIHELRLKLDAHFDQQRGRIDRLLRRTRKKLQRTIAGLREICGPELYSDILVSIAEKVRKPEVKELLLIRAEQSGGTK